MAYKHDYDKILRRLITILQWLNEGRSLTLHDLAEEFNVSTRTIRRDLEERLCGYPIEKQKGHYRMLSGYALEKTDEVQDVLVLEILEKFGESVGGDFATRAKTLLQKIKNTHESPIFTKIEVEDIGSQAPLFIALESCIHKRQPITLLYDFGEYDYPFTLHPYRLINFEGFWYLLALDAKRDIIKKFYLRKIKQIEPAEEAFTIPHDTQEKLQNALDIWFDPNAEPFDVLLRVSSGIAHYLERRPLAKTQIIESVHEDGSLDIRLQITSHEEILSTIFKWLPGIKVLKPKELDEEIIDILQGYIDYWDEE